MFESITTAYAVALVLWWVGHACIWTAILNDLYGRPLPKRFLKLWRLLTGIVILAGVPAFAYALDPILRPPETVTEWLIRGYLSVCMTFGLVILPGITYRRLTRPRSPALLAESTRTLDLWPELGDKLIGDGKWNWLPRLPFNDVFRVDFTELTLAPPRLPPAWDGLTLLVLSDLHFHGTPSRLFFDRVFDELAGGPTPDVVALVGDYVDTDTHHEWIRPLLGRLRWNETGLAILGNHDAHHHPDRIRGELAAAGYRVLSNRWEEATIRGVRCVVSGHEGPWLGRGPDGVPAGPFHLCLSHTPDHFAWGVRVGVDLMLCGHVHGGQVRLPVIGSIFVPSTCGRRYDQGVFQDGNTVMAVGRGLSGKEPLRLRCRPQVLRITLRSPANGKAA